MSFRIDPRLPLTAEVRRIASEELDRLVGLLASARAAPDNALHESRKRLKKLRALLCLVQTGDEQFCKAENMRYRDMARSLAGPREAAALIETVDRLAEAFPGKTAAGELDPVRAALVARRDAAMRESAHLDEAITAAVGACGQGRAALAGMVLPEAPEAAADLLADGAGKVVRRLRRALEAARGRGMPEDFHELRKAVKTHRLHVSLLHRLWPRPVRTRRKALDDLGERLGDLHDLSVLRRIVEDAGASLGPKRSRSLLLRLVKRSEETLRKTCLREAEQLFDHAPKPHKVAARYRAGVPDQRQASKDD